MVPLVLATYLRNLPASFGQRIKNPSWLHEVWSVIWIRRSCEEKVQHLKNLWNPNQHPKKTNTRKWWEQENVFLKLLSHLKYLLSFFNSYFSIHKICPHPQQQKVTLILYAKLPSPNKITSWIIMASSPSATNPPPLAAFQMNLNLGLKTLSVVLQGSSPKTIVGCRWTSQVEKVLQKWCWGWRCWGRVWELSCSTCLHFDVHIHVYINLQM